ncbi:MAG: CHASE2 domain-containing protein [Candidatus Riflebacteria bacterium]|nr:CHASE2 domain-containing protein [Candidatus Riflebacteria bacterium]
MIRKIFQEWRHTIKDIFRFSSTPLAVAIFFFVGAVPLYVFLSGYFDASVMERKLTDTKIRLISRTIDIDPRIVIIEIDANSLGIIKNQWPWPRAIYAELLRRLEVVKPAGVIFSILFQQLEGPQQMSQGDRELVEAMKSSRNVFLLQLIQETAWQGLSQTSIVSPHEDFCNACRGLGFSRVPLDEDNIARLLTVFMPDSDAVSLISCCLSALNAGKPLERTQLFDDQNLLVAYSGTGGIPRIPISTLLDASWKKQLSPGDAQIPTLLPSIDFFKDKLVIVGVTAPIFHDQFYSPDGLLSGVEFLANAVNTALHDIIIRNFNGVMIRLFFMFLAGIAASITICNPGISHKTKLLFLLSGIIIILCTNFFLFLFFHIQSPGIYLLLFFGYLYLLQLAVWGLKERLTKEIMEKELEIGRKMQMSLLPEHIPQVPGVDIFAETRPANEIGGDLFDFIQFPDGRLGILIGDVAGKGVQAGLFMGMASIILKHHGARSTSPAAALEEASRTLRDHFNGMAPTYLTGCFAVFDPTTMELSIANAGHEPPVFVTPDSGRIEQIPLFGPPLGPVWLMEPITYTTFKAHIVGGMTVVFFSDGFTEAFNASNKVFGRERFFELISLNADKTPAELGRILLESVKEFEADVPPSDDKTLVILKFSEAARKTLPLIDIGMDERVVKLRTNLADGWSAHVFPADFAILNQFVESLLKQIETVGFTSADCFSVELLLEEVFSNAWKHGCGKNPEKRISVLVRIRSDIFEIYIEDEGEGFILPCGETCSSSANSVSYNDSGRGLSMMLKYADKLSYNSKGNIVYLTKIKTTGTMPVA